MKNSLLSTKSLKKVYGKRDAVFEALKGIDIDINAGESVAIIGKSGSGKSTLMHLLALLDKPSEGEIYLNGQNTSHLKNRKLNRLRNNYGLRPVLTHIERYEHLMADEGLVEDLVDDGVIIQTNVGAFKGFSRKRRLLRYIKHGLIDVVVTDCHSLNRGNPDEYIGTIELIREKCGEEYVRHIVETSKKIFKPIEL